MAIIYNFALIKKNMSIFLKLLMTAWIIILHKTLLYYRQRSSCSWDCSPWCQTSVLSECKVSLSPGYSQL